MQRLIDAKEAIEELMYDSCYECSWGSDNPLSCDCDCTYREAIRMAINALTDAEPVVRCKDCKFTNECLLYLGTGNLNGYCMQGERREDAETN